MYIELSFGGWFVGADNFASLRLTLESCNLGIIFRQKFCSLGLTDQNLAFWENVFVKILLESFNLVDFLTASIDFGRIFKKICQNYVTKENIKWYTHKSSCTLCQKSNNTFNLPLHTPWWIKYRAETHSAGCSRYNNFRWISDPLLCIKLSAAPFNTRRSKIFCSYEKYE